jgi:hypothetical protein
MIRLRILAFCALLAITASSSFAKLQIFAGVNGMNPGDVSLPMKDLIWQFNTWSWAELDDRSTSPGFFGGTDRYPWPVKPVPAKEIRAAAPLDENNFPTQVPFTYGGKKYRPVWLFNWFLPTRLFPMGTYTFIAEGKGVVEFGWAKDVRIELKGGKTVFEFPITEMPAENIFSNETFNAGQGPKQSGLVMTILESDPTDHVRNIHLIRPDLNGGNSWAKDFETCPFNPQWLNDHRMYKSLRFMDWIGANQNGVVEWKDRISPQKFPAADRKIESAPYLVMESIHINHVPWEFMIKAVNAINCDIWICVPARANEDYVRNLAQLFKANLKPGIKVYLEWANETWNSIFLGLHSTNFVRDNYNSSVSSLYDAHAYMAVRNAKIFDEILGADRVVAIVSGHQASSGIGDNIMTSLKKSSINPTGYKVDGFAIQHYFGTSGPNRGQNQAAKNTANANGVKLYMYEGGTESGKGPAMYDLYKNALNAFDQDGFENYNAFVAVSGWGQYGTWGHMEYVNQPLADAHKYRALYDWAVSNGQFDPNTPLPACQGASVLNREAFYNSVRATAGNYQCPGNLNAHYTLLGKSTTRSALLNKRGVTLVKTNNSVRRHFDW